MLLTFNLSAESCPNRARPLDAKQAFNAKKYTCPELSQQMNSCSKETHLKWRPAAGFLLKFMNALQDEKVVHTDARLWQALHGAVEMVKDCMHSGKAAVKISAVKLLTKCIMLYSSGAVTSTGISAKEVRLCPARE